MSHPDTVNVLLNPNVNILGAFGFFDETKSTDIPENHPVIVFEFAFDPAGVVITDMGDATFPMSLFAMQEHALKSGKVVKKVPADLPSPV
jgi:hypothetical protein